jgi:salicylate hydroxylase
MKVVIAGAGVAGSACAVALRRIGADVTAYEAHPSPGGEVGSFVSLATNGLRVLEAIGCLEPIQRIGIDVERQLMWSSRGRLLGEMPRGRKSGDPLHSVTLSRADLVDCLRTEAVRAGADIATGHRLIAAHRLDDGGIGAVFDSGDIVDADLLIGADGIWSTTRAILDPTAPRPVYAGLWTMSGVARVPDGREPNGAVGTFNLTFARPGAFIHVPLGDGRVWWAAQVADPAAPTLEEPDLDLVARLFAHEAVPTELIGATISIHRPTLHHTLEPLRVTHDDRTVLVGDAAHPVGAGQGASMAIEDTAALAHHLGRGTSISKSLVHYDDARRDRVTKMTKMAAGNRDAKIAGRLGRRVQDMVMPFVFRHYYEKATAWLYDDDLGSVAATPGAPGQNRSA